MLTVHQGELMVQEKGIYSIEKFLVARRLMYWQVYLHKTVVSAEKHAGENHSARKGKNPRRRQTLFRIRSLDFFLSHSPQDPSEYLEAFSMLDDNDILSALKHWMRETDPVLSSLSAMLINRGY